MALGSRLSYRVRSGLPISVLVLEYPYGVGGLQEG